MTTRRENVPAAVVSAIRPPDSALVPTERDVLTGRLTDLDREDKHRSRDDHEADHGVEPAPATGPAPVPRPRFPRWAVVAAGAAVVVVVAGGVAVASGALGGGASPSSSGAAGADGAGSGDGGTGGGAGGGLPPGLDPAQVVGYAMTSTRALLEAGPGIDLNEVSGVGTTRESEWDCVDGTCRDGVWVLDVGDSTVSIEREEDTGLSGDEIPCYPVTMRLELALGDDGSYTGTMSREPTQIYAEWSGDGGSGSCSSVRYVDDVVLAPILAD